MIWAIRLIFRELLTFILWLAGNMTVGAIIAGAKYGSPVTGAAVGIVTGLICYGLSLKWKPRSNCPKCGGSAREYGEPTSRHHHGICNYCGGSKVLRPGASE